MRAAQNQVLDLATDVVAELHTPPARALDLFAELPLPLRAGVVIVLVATLCVPRLLRALDDHLFNRQARRRITRSTDWVEVVRIRNESRRLWDQRPSPTSADRNQPPDTTSDTADSGDAGGQDGGEPP
jgi:hypothetical protein